MGLKPATYWSLFHRAVILGNVQAGQEAKFRPILFQLVPILSAVTVAGFSTRIDESWSNMGTMKSNIKTWNFSNSIKRAINKILQYLIWLTLLLLPLINETSKRKAYNKYDLNLEARSLITKFKVDWELGSKNDLS